MKLLMILRAAGGVGQNFNCGGGGAGGAHNENSVLLKGGTGSGLRVLAGDHHFESLTDGCSGRVTLMNELNAFVVDSRSDSDLQTCNTFPVQKVARVPQTQSGNQHWISRRLPMIFVRHSPRHTPQ